MAPSFFDLRDSNRSKIKEKPLVCIGYVTLIQSQYQSVDNANWIFSFYSIIHIKMDRKRVNGPEASVAPIFKKTEEDVNVLDDEKKRLDNRGTEDLRPICK